MLYIECVSEEPSTFIQHMTVTIDVKMHYYSKTSNCNEVIFANVVHVHLV